MKINLVRTMQVLKRPYQRLEVWRQGARSSPLGPLAVQALAYFNVKSVRVVRAMQQHANGLTVTP
eukprot:4655459-Amphidinium_carterae.1